MNDDHVTPERIAAYYNISVADVANLDANSLQSAWCAIMSGWEEKSQKKN
jgi:hypothetical protein